VKDEPDQHTLIVLVQEMERQDYRVTIEDKFKGSVELIEAEEKGELNKLPMVRGVVVSILKGKENQIFRIQFLDIDSICITDLDCPPLIINLDHTIKFYKSGENN
jgi:hypothetical protein